LTGIREIPSSGEDIQGPGTRFKRIFWTTKNRTTAVPSKETVTLRLVFVSEAVMPG
jgi:hypothetical protein